MCTLHKILYLNKNYKYACPALDKSWQIGLSIYLSCAHMKMSSFWLNLYIYTFQNQVTKPLINFWSDFQNLINLLIGRIYPLFSDNIFSIRFFLILFASSSEIFSFGHYRTKLSRYFVIRGVLLLQNVKLKKLSVYF